MLDRFTMMNTFLDLGGLQFKKRNVEENGEDMQVRPKKDLHKNRSIFVRC